jgi:prevent-host-death family protein
MNEIPLRAAKAKFSALVSAAEGGEETVITKHGRAVARIVPEPSAGEKRVNHPGSPHHGMTFLELLMAYPGGLEIERDQTPMREIDLE